MKQVLMYTDGACSPNPGVGGWGLILISPSDGGFRREWQGGEPETTNNRMELTAVIEGLSALRFPCDVLIHTDSQYIQKAFDEKWIDNWSKNGWRTSSRKDVANRDLWESLSDLASKHAVSWVWVRGHSEDAENNRADSLAVTARKLVESTGQRFRAKLPDAPR